MTRYLSSQAIRRGPLTFDPSPPTEEGFVAEENLNFEKEVSVAEGVESDDDTVSFLPGHSTWAPHL